MLLSLYADPSYWQRKMCSLWGLVLCDHIIGPGETPKFLVILTIEKNLSSTVLQHANLPGPTWTL